ncbi:abortive phage infection protein [Lactococcus lactis]|uniref:Abortive phage resistance protein abiP n=1 Tax=Lactococcus lactis subsp. cremoris (strain MG1363) TaxID=416870 RepID=A2RIX6_LACLM|nr:putative phage abortive infection protein [Lactococcus cremoris]TRW53630.1 abortive phage infection protein [Lactococcus lactis]ADJ59634.1 abortive phage resistance protein abiP [Lactococcus cremoris subsp. cremoris NZ9000]MCT0507267.1 abortive phage infection protein [Lactococcus cremoris]MCT4407713.1 abortive phage infection protein [Lactococcus cremoris]MCT4436561.1 abortive phage infection protein [Lactococcus cremoris]
MGNILSGIIGLIGAILGVLGAYLVMKKQLKAQNEQYRKDKIDNTFFNLLGLFQNVREELDSSEIISDIKYLRGLKIGKDPYSIFKSIDVNNIINKQDDIVEIINEVFKSSTGYSGNYFRALYRCLKYIMDSDLKMEDKKFYSGVLRGVLSSKEMLLVFYNCMYFEKGEKFKELLEREENGKRIDFFGDEEDLKNLDKGYDLPFFSKEDLLFSEKDMQKLEELIKGN